MRLNQRGNSSFTTQLKPVSSHTKIPQSGEIKLRGYSGRKAKYDSIRMDLRALAQQYREEGETLRKCVRCFTEIKREFINIRGREAEDSVSESVQGIGLTFLCFPADPTGVTYVIGATTYGIGHLLRSLERRRMGVRDVMRMYRKLGLELRYVLEV